MKQIFRMSQGFIKGLRDGMPICFGYFSVSFAFGITVAGAGFPPWIAALISITNLTSAGQLAGLTVLAGGGTLIEMAMTQFVINLRYALMSFSLTQKLPSKLGLGQRMGVSYFITDEIFAVAASQTGEVSPAYMYGLSIVPCSGWVLGTFIGASAGSALPEAVVSALGIAIYGMFIAIVVPESKKHRNVFAVAAGAAALSCVFHFVPMLKNMTEGFVIIICAVTMSLLGAYFYPVNQDEEENGRA